MISKRSIDLFVLSCQLGMLILPFRWNASTQKFELNPKLVQKSWQSTLWFGQVTVVLIVMFAYMLLVAYFILFSDLLSRAEKALAGFQISLCLIILPLHRTLYFSGPHVVNHMNALIQLNNNLRNPHSSNKFLTIYTLM